MLPQKFSAATTRTAGPVRAVVDATADDEPPTATTSTESNAIRVTIPVKSSLTLERHTTGIAGT